MNENDELDLLDRRLREAVPYIDDAGFTRRVLQALPAPRRRAVESYRAMILLSITVLGSLLAYFLSDGGRFISEGLVKLAYGAPIVMFLVAIASGLVITGLGMAAALWKNQEFGS